MTDQSSFKSYPWESMFLAFTWHTASMPASITVSNIASQYIHMII